MDKQETIALEQEYVLGVYSRPPFVLAGGKGSTLFDTDGNQYIDCVSGIAVNSLGYNDPGINQAVQEATSTGMFHVSNLYHTEPHAQLAKSLCELSFADKVHFSLTGADANEGAFKFARRYAREHGHSEKYHILAFTNAFHGRLFASLAATPRPQYQEPFAPLVPGVRFAEFNNLDSAKEQMDENVCAIIVEPIQGEGGIYPATYEFLHGLRALADQYDALLIYDEVQCGLGRTGNLWGHHTVCHSDRSQCQQCNGGTQPCVIEPDLMTLAKPLAGGLPIGAILMRQKVADTIHKGDHASTFAGNPFTTHVAHHVVQRVSQPEFLASVKAKGNYLKELLEELNSPHIKEIRGEGLLIGVEMDIATAPIITKGYEKGVILVNAGANVLRFVPPLVITEEEIAKAVSVVGEILQSL
ncbi:MAG: acetylornithine/succinylornithine family transaminase [Caldilineaceae bacterium]|nr:acetylornithine/succinylornithine family transaminase [Caldilineaceae bacterium]